MKLSELSFPLAASSVFDKTISHDWYDGITSGIATSSRLETSYRFDIVTWDARQEHRIFALSRIDERDFIRIEELLKTQGSPNWPVWFPSWPDWSPSDSPMSEEIGTLLAKAQEPREAVAADSMFSTLYGAKVLDEKTRSLLPSKFNGHPSTGDYQLWKEILGLTE